MEILNNSTLILNLILVSILAFYLIRGYTKGFVTQFFGFFSLIVSIVFAWFLYLPFGKLFPVTPKAFVPFQDTILDVFFYEKVNALVWFVILFVIGVIVMRILKGVFNVVSKVPGISLANRVLGMVFGFINFVIISYIAIYLLSLPIFSNGNDLINRSLLNTIVKVSDTVSPMIVDKLEVNQILEIFESTEQASVEDVEKMQEYLKKNNISLDEMNEFLMEINKW